MKPSKEIEAKLREYSADSYPVSHFARAVCKCGHDVFTLAMNEEEGVAVRWCCHCDDEHGIGDSDDYIDEVESIEECSCKCKGKEFQIVCGVSLYAKSKDVRWFYVGCRCVKCGLAGCYGDWKNEYIDYRKLLKRV